MNTNSSPSSKRSTVIAIVSILSVGVLAATLILRNGSSSPRLRAKKQLNPRKKVTAMVKRQVMPTKSTMVRRQQRLTRMRTAMPTVSIMRKVAKTKPLPSLLQRLVTMTMKA